MMAQIQGMRDPVLNLEVRKRAKGKIISLTKKERLNGGIETSADIYF
jgi:hypothetical protein